MTKHQILLRARWGTGYFFRLGGQAAFCNTKKQPVPEKVACPRSQALVFSLTRSGIGCAGIRIGPRLSPAPRQRFPQGVSLKSADAGTWRLLAGPGRGSKHPKESVRAALKVETYRLRSEGLPPAEMQHELSRLY